MTDISEKDIVYDHDILSQKNRRRRRNNAINWRKDRTFGNKFPLVDRKLCKRMLHKKNRKDPDICSSAYYKADCRLSTVSWGMT